MCVWLGICLAPNHTESMKFPQSLRPSVPIVHSRSSRLDLVFAQTIYLQLLGSPRYVSNKYVFPYIAKSRIACSYYLDGL